MGQEGWAVRGKTPGRRGRGATVIYPCRSLGGRLEDYEPGWILEHLHSRARHDRAQANNPRASLLTTSSMTHKQGNFSLAGAFAVQI